MASALPDGEGFVSVPTDTFQLPPEIKVAASQIKGAIAQISVSGSTFTLTSPDGTAVTATLPATTTTTTGGGLTRIASCIASR